MEPCDSLHGIAWRFHELGSGLLPKKSYQKSDFRKRGAGERNFEKKSYADIEI